MDISRSELLSRRRFLVSAGALGAAAWLGPPGLRFHREPGIVEEIRHAAAVDPMQVQRLRGNLSATIGSGGNIVALPGPDGVLLIDSGIDGRRVAASVATIRSRPRPLSCRDTVP
jgi:hypothetical protein